MWTKGLPRKGKTFVSGGECKSVEIWLGRRPVGSPSCFYCQPCVTWPPGDPGVPSGGTQRERACVSTSKVALMVPLAPEVGRSRGSPGEAAAGGRADVGRGRGTGMLVSLPSPALQHPLACGDRAPAANLWVLLCPRRSGRPREHWMRWPPGSSVC